MTKELKYTIFKRTGRRERVTERVNIVNLFDTHVWQCHNKPKFT